MDYMTLKEASEKWNISPRMINYYCSAGRIPGAEKKVAHPERRRETDRRPQKEGAN